MEDCKVRWGPSIHRDLHGHKNDHALLSCRFKWRIRTHKSKPAKDFTALATTYDDRGKAIHNNEVKQKFEQVMTEKLDELSHSDTDITHKMYLDMCAVISHAIAEVLPTVSKRRRVKRAVSAKTKSLYDKRSNMQGCLYDW